jgi:aminoglycoside phosphotransferase (APT) family kinase protein
MRDQDVRPLVDYLASGAQQEAGSWREWQIARVEGGWSNLLYRATGPAGDLVCKFTKRDERDRAGREYHALLALHEIGLPIAPEPILLDLTSYAQPVVVQTWLEGVSSAALPSTDAEWEQLVKHLALVHTVAPDETPVQLRHALGASTTSACRNSVWEQVGHIPQGAQPPSLEGLLCRFRATHFPDWPAVPLALCRADAHILNFIRRPGLWASVDWEASGWGDPAFEVADLIAHAAYAGVPLERWEWVIETYCRLAGDAAVAGRVQVYYKVLIVWWAARLCRYLYEIPRGVDRRLVDLPAGWQADVQAKYERYLALAEVLYP